MIISIKMKQTLLMLTNKIIFAVWISCIDYSVLQFMSSEFKNIRLDVILLGYNTKHIVSAHQHPPVNGSAEKLFSY